jgi:hypothetical protein
MKPKILFLAGLLLAVSSGIAMADLNVESIIGTIDKITELKTNGTAKVIITQQKNKKVKVMETIYYRRDSTKSFLIVYTSPEVEKGNGYLKKDNNLWMYRRNTRSFQHINRDESIGGSDAKAEEFEGRKLTEMYKPALNGGKEIIKETMLGSNQVYQFNIDAKTEDVAYPKRTYWVRKDNFLPLKVQSYSLNGTLMQTAYYIKYTKLKDTYLWVKAIFVDEFEKGNKTIVELSNLSLNRIDDCVFTQAYLESLSK